MLFLCKNGCTQQVTCKNRIWLNSTLWGSRCKMKYHYNVMTGGLFIFVYWVSFDCLGQMVIFFLDIKKKHKHYLSVKVHYSYWICINKFWSHYVIWKWVLFEQCFIRLIPNGIPLIPFCYLSSEQKCLESVSSAVWDGIRSDFSIYPPPDSSSLTTPNLLLPFHDDRKPSGAWRTPSRLTLSRGNIFE